MAINMLYGFQIHRESGGYWAECIELKGCRSEGDTIEELKANLQEALDVYLSEPENSKLIFPKAKKHINNKKNIILVKPSLGVAFAYSLRALRLKKGMTQRQMATSLGYKSTNAYQKLESPKTNPGLETLSQLKKVLPELEIDNII